MTAGETTANNLNCCYVTCSPGHWNTICHAFAQNWGQVGLTASSKKSLYLSRKTFLGVWQFEYLAIHCNCCVFCSIWSITSAAVYRPMSRRYTRSRGLCEMMSSEPHHDRISPFHFSRDNTTHRQSRSDHITQGKCCIKWTQLAFHSSSNIQNQLLVTTAKKYKSYAGLNCCRWKNDKRLGCHRHRVVRNACTVYSWSSPPHIRCTAHAKCYLQG